ncbi:MAG TPA: DUF1264 domain-containing protein [Pirellulaceae bacterium]
MKRRDVFGMIGALGTGLSLSSSPLAAQEHGAHSAGPTPNSPLSHPHAHFCGIHVAKNDPKFQIIVQHYCAAHSGETEEDQLFQCVLFDSTEANAKLLGIEYIISDQQFRKLPEAEQKYWHPHTYEVLGGGLIAPAMKPDDELAFMKKLLTTWGKTWHTWPDPTTPIPVGEPLLIWALTADGQPDPRIVAERDAKFHVSVDAIREQRGQAIGYEVPNVSAPTSIDQIGRQWTDNGPDVPKPRK